MSKNIRSKVVQTQEFEHRNHARCSGCFSSSVERSGRNCHNEDKEILNVQPFR